ncbi:DUF2480 family protein [soil metagenome]
MSEVIVNRVAESVLSTIDLEDFYPAEDVKRFDLKDYLFMELVLKEKDFREALKNTDWQSYSGKIAAVTCSADAIIPMWAYMLVAAYLQPVAAAVIYGDEKTGTEALLLKNIKKIDVKEYAGKRVVIKGCGEKQVSERAYIEITLILRPVVKSIMYGEPCSTVPVYKQTTAK